MDLSRKKPSTQRRLRHADLPRIKTDFSQEQVFLGEDESPVFFSAKSYIASPSPALLDGPTPVECKKRTLLANLIFEAEMSERKILKAIQRIDSILEQLKDRREERRKRLAGTKYDDKRLELMQTKE